jgi:hypothetical protein
MRQEALRLMECLQDFSPRLLGSVWSGNIRQGSDIDLHAYSQDLESIQVALEKQAYEYRIEVVRTLKYGEPREFTHLHLAHVGGFEAEITLYDPQELHQRPRCSITGKTMKRATLSELRQLLSSRAIPLVPSLQWPDPLDWDWLELQIPELSECKGVLQNHYHHLDVYDHTLAVVEGLQRLLDDNFERFPTRRDQLQAIFASSHERQLLLLAGLCHDLGKPATQSFGRDGRIHFHGHDLLGAQMVRPIASRLGLGSSQMEQLSALVECHLHAVLLSEGGCASQIHHLFARCREALPHLALLSLADVEASRGPAQSGLRLDRHKEFVDFLLEEHFEGGFLANPVVPIHSDDLHDDFGHIEAKLLRRLEHELLDAYLDGEFEGKEDGLALAAELLNRYWRAS